MTSHPVSRRTTLKFAGLIALAASGYGHAVSGALPSRGVRGYGTDPDLMNRPVTWSRTLDKAQLAMLRALADLILPKEPPHPSAADTGVHEFLDEWVSAPYPEMQADRALILNGLDVLEGAMRRVDGIQFADAPQEKQIAVFDQLCHNPSTVRFANRLIELVCGGYYTTRDGHAAIGYVGNVGLTSFPGPPPEVVRHLERTLSQLVGH
jgi:hypothetical protein